MNEPKPQITFDPVPVRARRDGWTVERQYAFIEALAETGMVEEACRRVGMSRTSADNLRSRPCA
jgi:molybdenum-dependent DNA-binding transcriptional regulator ModE